MSDLRRAFDADNYLGEGLIWSIDDQSLWWINCEQPAEILRWSPDAGTTRRWPLPKRIGGFVHKAGGGLLVALSDGIYDFDPETNALALHAASPLPDHIKLHECHCDRQGRFWVGAYDHHYPADRDAAGGSFFRLDGDLLIPMIDGIAVANGLAFSPDGSILYAASSPARTVWAFDLDPSSGAISNRRVFVELEAGFGHIDGATVDADGGYWMTCVGASALRRYTPDGALDREITLPFPNPTKVAFGGRDLATLFITSTRMMINAAAPHAEANGAVFAFEPGEHGVPDSVLR